MAWQGHCGTTAKKWVILTAEPIRKPEGQAETVERASPDDRQNFIDTQSLTILFCTRGMLAQEQQARTALTCVELDQAPQRWMWPRQKLLIGVLTITFYVDIGASESSGQPLQ